jgi:6-phosphogluconolactonase
MAKGKPVNIETYPDHEMMAIDLANILAGEIEASLFHNEFVTFAVPGGSTPGPIFDALCGADLDWSRVLVMLTDERWVPEGHPRSNTTLIKERLLTARAAKASFLPFYSEGHTPQSAAPLLCDTLKDKLPVSVLLLGMGDDMHTASLFPGAPDIVRHLADDAPAVVATAPASQPEERVSLSGPVLNGALSKHLVITGQAKLNALKRAETLALAQAPIGAVLTGVTVHWAA